MQIRKATLADEEAVTQLWHANNLVAVYNDPSHDFRFAVQSACSDVLVGEDIAGHMAGTVMVGHDGHRGWLYYVATIEKRKGYGRALVEAAEQWLRERGVPKVQILIRESNEGVLPFYLSCGFESTPRIVCGKWLHQATS